MVYADVRNGLQNTLRPTSASREKRTHRATNHPGLKSFAHPLADNPHTIRGLRAGYEHTTTARG